jgi:hypothetical protein
LLEEKLSQVLLPACHDLLLHLQVQPSQLSLQQLVEPQELHENRHFDDEVHGKSQTEYYETKY